MDFELCNFELLIPVLLFLTMYSIVIKLLDKMYQKWGSVNYKPPKGCHQKKSLHKTLPCSGGAISVGGGVDSVAMLKKIRILFIIHSINRHCLCSFSHRRCVRVSYFQQRISMKHFRNNEFYECLLLPHVGFGGGTFRLEEEATSNRGGEVVKGDDGFSSSSGDGDERG